MRDDNDDLSPFSANAATSSDVRTDRRRAIGLGAAAAGGVWIAPAILSMDAAAAQTVAPPDPGSVSGFTVTCQGVNDPGVPVVLTGPEPSPASVQVFSDQGAFYLFANVAPGAYNVARLGDPFGSDIVVNAGQNTTVDLSPLC